MKTKRESPSKKKKIFIVRSERDSLHDKKRELQEPMRAARDKRDAAVAEMRVHKKKRDELQAKAKELIEFKRSVRGAPLGDLKKEVRVVEADIKIMELKQQTVPLKLTEERELLEKIKARAGDLQRIKKLLADQEKIQKEVKDVDASIDALFKFADKEHSEVVRLSEEQHKFHEEAQAYLATRKALDDKDKKDRAADEALQTLLKKGKIQI